MKFFRIKPFYLHYFILAFYPIGSFVAFGYLGLTVEGLIAVVAVFFVSAVALRFNRCPSCRKAVSHIPLFKIGDHTVWAYSPIVPSRCSKCGTDLK